VTNTVKKLKLILPSLKVPVKMSLKSKAAYKVNCSGCDACMSVKWPTK